MKQRRLFLLLQRCNSVSKLHRIHAQIILHGFSQKSSLVHKLISCCVKCGDLKHASLAFEDTRVRSTTVWNQMIRGFSKSPTPGHSLLLYNRLMRKEEGVVEVVSAGPNAFTYTFLLSACSDGRLPSLQGRQLHCRIVRSGFFASSVYVQTGLINMYGSDGAVGDARKVFDEMSHRNSTTWNSLLAGYVRAGLMGEAMKVFDKIPNRDVVSWTTVISAYTRMGKPKRALDLFRRMEAVGGGHVKQPDQVTMVVALTACADLGDLELGRRIHIHIHIHSYSWLDCPRSVNLDNALVNMYAKCGDVDEAHRVFIEMPRRTVVSWSTMIMGFVMNGKCKQALDVFKWMMIVGDGERPDEVTFLGVLCACGQSGRLDEGLWYFNFMTRTCNICPGIQHYGCLVDMLSRDGRVDEALEVIEKDMPMKPSESVWSALLNGCGIHGDLKMATRVGHQLMELNININIGGQLAQLSNIYAASARWEDVLRLRRRMVEMRVRKPGGRSWILVDGVVHEFMAGDQTRKCDPVVYDMVREIVEGAKQEGYLPHLSQVRLDVEEEERELFLRVHSEKLAMAYGLISIADSRTPLRIVTNLCMCSDCHSIAKYVSGSFKRVVIIRERNRFHRFSGGTCSCTPENEFRYISSGT